MMISSEAYYDSYLKGKSEKEIMKIIRSLKREINSLKRELENPPESVDLVFPDKMTRLTCNRQYLARAIEAYEEAGGEYVPTKMEQKSLDFNRDLANVKKVAFTIGGYFDGYKTSIYTIEGNKVLSEVKHTLRFKPSFIPEYCSFTKEEFIDALRNVHIDEWKKDYTDLNVLDGTQWELEIQFNGNRRPLHIYGSNAYPYNFMDLVELLDPDERDNMIDII